MKKVKGAFLVLLGLFLTAPVFAKTLTYTAQCNIQVIDPKKAPNPPARVTGTGTGKTADAACAAAKKDATQKAPAGTYARHCQCKPA
ncbi:hypothetical protein [Neisseria weaveri]|uniref:Periplasmic protein n=1 Tax=Neisseria weaveri TaxID=28091 RepID=A0A3S4YPP4_9NEIS|nr:hypothetical protein [Neisseria weaveri]EGV38459.1 hypothetical protein l11_04820 [Neisseria weaveri LMG 5135]VEJ49982.1 Uncharacterised protein [Neisseria weaveri]